MICSVCEGKGIVPAEHETSQTARSWDGAERRTQYRNNDNQTLKFNEVVPAARYKSCPRCLGSGKTHPNLMFV
jgi:DnaJ-class molecular chaperone